jgi:hypothetical protein
VYVLVLAREVTMVLKMDEAMGSQLAMDSVTLLGYVSDSTWEFVLGVGLAYVLVME